MCFCSNSVNIYVGIGVPWLIDTLYNFIAYRKPLQIQNANGLSFSLLVFFATSFACIVVLVFRRLTLGAELGGPRFWAWVTCAYFMLLWVIFVVVSSLKVSGIIQTLPHVPTPKVCYSSCNLVSNQLLRGIRKYGNFHKISIHQATFWVHCEPL